MVGRGLTTSPTGNGRTKPLPLPQAINISTGTFCIKYLFPGISVSLVCSKSVSKISLIFKPKAFFVHGKVIIYHSRIRRSG